MNAITKLDLLHLEALVDRYDAGELIRYWPAANGIENSNYFLATQKDGIERQYVLTIMEQPSNAGGALVPLLDSCVDAGLPVPAVVRDRDGSAYGRLDGKPMLLCKRLPGQHAYNPTTRQVEALGRFTARFHNATAKLAFPLSPYPRDAKWLSVQAQACVGRVGWAAADLMKDTARRIARGLERQDVRSLPQGPIHGDLFRDNVLFNDQGLTGVLDFHHAATGYLIYDLAVAANDWCTDAQGAIDPERTMGLLRAYHAIRPLQKQELWHFPVFCLYAALAFWLSRSTVALRSRGKSGMRSNNPNEFQRIVAHHTSHFFYVDDRQLN
jgi:homoserine kinase type II